MTTLKDEFTFTIAEKIQNEEGKVWDGGSVKQGKLTGQQLKVGGKGMKGFYGCKAL